ncbi:MAG: enoyl-CoA hydratase/isomerase family protein [bacterium]
MKNEYIFVDTGEQDVAVITIDRPPVNALNSVAYAELYNAFYNLGLDDSVKVVVITGAGEKAFVAGADVREFLNFNSENGALYTRNNQYIREFIRKYNKPVICAVNGWAFGGGLALALMCDIRFACPEAKFNLGEINMGILGATQYIAGVTHSGMARLLVYGETINAEEALRAGIIDKIVPRDELLTESVALAKRIASKPPLALKYAKQCMIKSEEVLLEEGLVFEEAVLKVLWGSEDKNEAVSAFLEKRKPVFKNK